MDCFFWGRPRQRAAGFYCLGAVALLLPLASTARATVDLEPSVHVVEPGDDLQYRLQNILIQAVPGDEIRFTEGRFALRRQIDVATHNITLRGEGPEKTILSFQGQRSGGQGMEFTGDNLVIENLAVEDSAGNAIKVLGAQNVTFRNVRVEWTGEASATNGAYGLYPVQCENVLVDGCEAYGASDAGIYVGQCRQVVIRNCRAERNVAGIEVENTVGADVYDNVATNNAGGLLVFDLPGLQLKQGGDVRVFRNRVFKNNHVNFAAPGSMVAGVPQGTGLMIMATDRVEVFENEIADNQTGNLALVSYEIQQKKKRKGEDFDGVPEAISIHHNRFAGGGDKPTGELGEILVQLLDTPLPDILFDGVYDATKLLDGQPAAEVQHAIHDNGDATFANFNLPEISPVNLVLGRVPVVRELTAFAAPRAALPEIALDDHEPPAENADLAVAVYRAAPKSLAEWGLFVGNGRSQEPAAGVVPYDLNTPLFSDYTSKYRFIRVPEGSTIDYAAEGLLKFPEGTVIAKTFAYPIDMTDPSQGERLLETRIEFLEDGQWYGYSYIWNDEQTAAELALGGGELEASWVHADGRERTNHYEIPNANQCLNCHSESKSYVPIGPTVENMNRAFPYHDGLQNQLEKLADEHLLTGLPAETARPQMPSFEDPHSGTVDQRARAWLHVNCAHCHNPVGTARTSGLDLRVSQTDVNKLGYFKPPVAAGQGSGGLEYDIVPGHPEKSILLYRIESSDPSIRMPNVARNMVPTEAAELIREWIAGLAEGG